MQVLGVAFCALLEFLPIFVLLLFKPGDQTFRFLGNHVHRLGQVFEEVSGIVLGMLDTALEAEDQITIEADGFCRSL
jgi:hypothetical protein